MNALLLCLLAIAFAPVVDRGLRGRPRLESFTDGLVQVAVAGILLVNVLPFGLASAGWPAAVALGGGALLGGLAHRLPAGRGPVEALAIAALLLHALVDGAALATSDETGLHLLGEAVVLHTLPVALATWRIGRARLGPWGSGGLLLATALATFAGWHATGQSVVASQPAAIGLIQCAIAGALLHVLGHLGEGGRPRAAGVGALTGAAVVVALGLSHPLPEPFAGELPGGRALLAISLVSAPWLLAGYLGSGALRVWGGERFGRPWRGVAAVLQGALRGLWAPVSSCEAPAAAESMVDHGVSPRGALAFLAAAPSLAVATLLLSAPLLGAEGLGIRLGGALLVGLAAGASTATGPAAGHHHAHGHTRGWSAFRDGVQDAVEHTAPWVLSGLWIAAMAEPLLPTGALAGIPPLLAIVGAALIGLPAYICAVGVTPLVAVLLHKGLAPGAAVALLLAGPAASASVFRSLRLRAETHHAARYLLAVGLGSVAVGLAVQQLGLLRAPPDLHLLATRATGPVELGSALVLIVLFAAALLHNGPRGFLEPLMHPHAGEHEAGDGEDTEIRPGGLSP